MPLRVLNWVANVIWRNVSEQSQWRPTLPRSGLGAAGLLPRAGALPFMRECPGAFPASLHFWLLSPGGSFCLGPKFAPGVHRTAQCIPSPPCTPQFLPIQRAPPKSKGTFLSPKSNSVHFR